MTVRPGLVTNDGQAIGEWSFKFSTDGAADDDPTSDPTPHVGEPDVGEAAGGCCSTADGAGSIALGLLALVAIRRPRRARS